jgi:DNA-binding NarL/FixJ family response regulator
MTEVASALSAVIRRLASQVANCPFERRIDREVLLPTARYQLGASVVEEAAPCSSPAILVTVQRTNVEPLTDGALQARYHLTVREVAVARLLARGRRGAEIASTLGISPHTVARHTEHVLSKLGLHSRAGVGVLMRGE